MTVLRSALFSLLLPLASLLLAEGEAADGETFVLEAGPEFELLPVNRLGARTLASPALVDGRRHFRTENELVEIGSPPDSRSPRPVV